MSLTYGIDVSNYQGVIDWQKVKQAGCQFAILKITKKDLTPDAQFYNNVKGCKAQGIPYDVYRYVYENTTEAAQKAASAVVALLDDAGAPKSTRIWWDVEDGSICPSNSKEKRQLTDSILAAQQVAEQAGYLFGVYCGLYWYQSVLSLDGLTCPFWVARYPTSRQLDLGTAPDSEYRPKISHTLWGWQYSSHGKLPGINGTVDFNEIYLAGSSSSPSHQSKTDPVIQFQLWLREQGETGLAADGVFGAKSRKAAIRVLQRLLNRQSGAALTVDGLFGAKTKAAVVTLKQGDQGELVYLLQGLLYAHGYDPKGFDGSFGAQTKKAVTAFQKAKKLTADGLAGKETVEKLAGECRE